MEQYLETREKIRQGNPGLLSSMRERIAVQMHTNDTPEKIDRQKNIQTVQKLLEITTASMGFQDRVKDIITQTRL